MNNQEDPKSKPSQGVHLHPEKHDVPQYGKKVSNVPNPSAGATPAPGKEVGSCDDSLGKPGRFTRNANTVAAPRDNSREHVKKQLGDNGMQAN